MRVDLSTTKYQKCTFANITTNKIVSLYEKLLAIMADKSFPKIIPFEISNFIFGKEYYQSSP
jgi:hypothetical protein